jgi:YD repeat-containing protein
VDYSYDSDGSILAAAALQGITRFTYDRGGRLTAITDPGGATTAFVYDSAGLLSLVAPGFGQDVVVDFVEGSPDQPLIVGALYRDTTGRLFSVSVRGRLRTCTSCP